MSTEATRPGQHDRSRSVGTRIGVHSPAWCLTFGNAWRPKERRPTRDHSAHPERGALRLCKPAHGPTTYDRAWPPFVSRAMHSPPVDGATVPAVAKQTALDDGCGSELGQGVGKLSSSRAPYSGRCVRSGPEVVPTDREPLPAPPDGTVTETISSRRSSLDGCGASRASVSAVQSPTDALSQVRWPKADLRQAGERLSFSAVTAPERSAMR